MKHIKFTYVDSITGISIETEPTRNGPAHPKVKGLEFVWARESAYPTNLPEFFGTCPDNSDIKVDGVTGEFGQSDWLQMQADEMNARPNPITKEEDRQKHRGIEILGVMCSATKADQMGLTAVGLDYSMTTGNGGVFASTQFEFANGTTLVITSDNFAAVYNAWVPFRRSFFKPE